MMLVIIIIIIIHDAYLYGASRLREYKKNASVMYSKSQKT